MLNVRVLIVDGVEVPVQASHGFTQRYLEQESKARRRFLGGGLWQRKVWGGKIRTEISGDGVAPAGIQELDTDNPITLACVASRGINSASNVIVLPAARRADTGSEPFGFAVVDEQMVPTTCNVVTNTATLGVVAGANQYQVRYFPLITVLADPLEEDLSRGGSTGWSLTCEEV